MRNRDWMYRIPVWLNETNGKTVDKVIADVWVSVDGLRIKSVNEFRVVSVDVMGIEGFLPVSLSSFKSVSERDILNNFFNWFSYWFTDITKFL
jgi:hypothetical protein